MLIEYLGYGAEPQLIQGVDLLAGRLHSVHARLPHIPLTCADGQQLPCRDETFDLVLQYTVFSSILDDRVRANLAGEMLRVLRKPDGLIIWYDFWLNPTNKQTRGIRPPEIQRLFPGCEFEFHLITLAPPIARSLANVSWLVCCVLERLAIFNTHYLVAIRPKR